jgi:AraC family transcriptional regulator
MSSQSLAHPLELTKPEWLQVRRSINLNGLVVQHDIESPDEVQSSGLSHHFLCLYLNGWGNHRQITRCEDQEYDGEQKRGDFWLVPAERPGHWCWEGTDEAMLFVIDPSFLLQIGAETNILKGDRVELLSTVSAHDPTLLSLAVSFQQEMQQPQWGSQLYLESLANLFCIHLLRHYCAHQPILRDYKTGLSTDQLKQVRDFIQAHLDQGIQLVDLAQTANMSRYHFSKLFKQSTGITPHQYLLQQRIRRAKELLTQQQEVAIAEIAIQCGFANQSHFTAQFRKAIGTTPKQFREQV